MTEIEKHIEELTVQLQQLKRRQLQMTEEIIALEKKLVTLRARLFNVVEPLQPILHQQLAHSIPPPAKVYSTPSTAPQPEAKNLKPARQKLRVNGELEDFIGTNIISKTGILVTIIGVFIGSKYAIDNELISPVMRIVAGYVSAGILAAIALRLRDRYLYFSSVLIGGGLAVAYFITYIAYSFYDLFPLWLAFALMILTTAVAVFVALWYNQKVIALLGQVAAYAIPFLLSSGSGNVSVLFGYITVINFGLLLLSFTKDWKLLYHIAFFLTWFIYLLLTAVKTNASSNTTAALTFLAINFFTFYITFLSYKIFKKELYQLAEVTILLLNALLFFFLASNLIDTTSHNVHALTWFTITNACIHLAAGYIIFRLRLVDKSVFQFIFGLGLLFITIAIPIELDGNWVTVLWTLEATVLTYVGVTSKRQLYLQIALPLIAISFLSLLQDWSASYPFIDRATSATASRRSAFANINFALSLFVCWCMGYISLRVRNFAFSKQKLTAFFSTVLPIAFLGLLYFTFYNEIHFAFDKRTEPGNSAVGHLRSVTVVMFSCVYLGGWLFVNTKMLRNERLHYLLLTAALFANAAYVFRGLFALGQLRDARLAHPQIASNPWFILRYFSLCALAFLWLSASYGFKRFKPSIGLQRAISTVFNITLLAVISNEFIHWMDLAGYQNQYKLGLSLICGGYALTLLFIGIVGKKKRLRIFAIVLFAATLLKLFFYDLASLSTISKTIVLVLLGILLLIASYLYNKYKDLLFANEETDV